MLIYKDIEIQTRRVKALTDLPDGQTKIVLDQPDEEIVGIEFPYEIYYGRIVDALEIGENGNPLGLFKVDMGIDKIVHIVSGINRFHNINALVGTRQLVVTNIPHKNLSGYRSEGAMLFANEHNRNPKLFQQIEVANGQNTRVGLGENTIFNTNKIRSRKPYYEPFYISDTGYFSYKGHKLEINGKHFRLDVE